MRYIDYENAFSQARLSRYLSACNNDKNKALTLYRHNIKLCQKFYGILSLFEITLRNEINKHYKAKFVDENWIQTQIVPSMMLGMYPDKAAIIKKIDSLTSRSQYTHDNIISSVSFGFWTYLFNKKPFRSGGQNLLEIFPHRTIGLGQNTVYKELMEIKKFRNRIAHHEPICFDSLGNININYAQSNYDLILKYVFFLGYDKNQLFFGLDILPDKTISQIRDI